MQPCWRGFGRAMRPRPPVGMTSDCSDKCHFVLTCRNYGGGVRCSNDPSLVAYRRRAASHVLVAIAVLWVRSYWRGDQLVYRVGDRVLAVLSTSGTISFSGSFASDQTLWDRQHHGYLSRPAWAAPTGSVTRGLQGIRSKFDVFGIHWLHHDRWFSKSFGPIPAVWELVLPTWMLFAVTGTCTFVLFVKRPRNPRDGLCPACSYDLRASKGRCPECGKSIEMNQ